MWFIVDGCGITCVAVAYGLLLFAAVVVNVFLLEPWAVPSTRWAGLLWYDGFLVMSVWAHLAAMLTDPGTVPHEVCPPVAEEGKDSATKNKDHRFCKQCNSVKPPRAHHCSICRRCIMRMDHHCPWVNNCVGATNQKHFLLFIFYVLLQALLAMFTVGSWLVSCNGAGMGRSRPGGGFLEKGGQEEKERWLRQRREEAQRYLHGHPGCRITEGWILAGAGVFFVAVIFGLFTAIMICDQASNIMSDQTTVEALQKTEKRARTCSEACQETLGRGPSWRWLFPVPVKHGSRVKAES